MILDLIYVKQKPAYLLQQFGAKWVLRDDPNITFCEKGWEDIAQTWQNIIFNCHSEKLPLTNHLTPTQHYLHGLLIQWNFYPNLMNKKNFEIQ